MTLILSGTDGVSDIDGTAATPAIRGTDTNTGIFFPAADTIAFAEGGVEAMRIDSSGNVGIGVTPSAWGSLYKAIEGGDSNNQSSFSFRTDANIAALGANFYYDGSTNVYKHTGTAGLYQVSGNEFIWYNAPSGTGGTGATFTERMRIDSSGNVGIGTSSPSSFNALVAIKSASDRDSIQYVGGSSYAMRFGSNASFAAIDGVDAATGSTSYQPICLRGSIVLLNTGGTERARITSTGQFLIGTTSFAWTPTTTGYQFEAPSAPWFIITSDSSAAANTAGPTVYNRNATYNGTRFTVRIDGGIENYSANNVNLSDERVKTNIELSGNYLDKICAIPIKLFNYKDEPEGTQKSLGVIAQDVELIIPEFVNASDGWGKQETENKIPLKTVYETDLMFALMKSIQELKAITDAQAAKIETLEAQNAAFEARLAALENK